MCKTVDLGNGNYKLLAGDKRIMDCSYVQEVQDTAFGAWQVNGKHYLFGQNAKSKVDTNKITENKKALLGRILYPITEDKEVTDINVLMPLSLYFDKQNREDFQKLLAGNYKVSNDNGATKSFKIKSVDVYPESFSSLMTKPELLKEPIYLIDMGNYDVSMVYVNKTPDQNKLYTDVKGMAIVYKELSRVLTSKMRRTIDEGNTKLLLDKYDTLPEDIKVVIDTFMNDYIQTNIYDRLDEIQYDDLIHRVIMTGGGSVALKRWLREDVFILDDALFSNVEGAKIVATRKKGAK
ncbi:ParM/StbA family protein [Romboutsia weinsteinii]|uniref:ParM/StbA family protein n=1 Tax=Romboutsia weinsteinii TaxID=2020949 RepID=A0A371JAH2_9FIRM|nr:ParM/StbA family protein [Romboutsia weinsteinii]RDY29770.1 ParM/StbA family protein [Romboutsia weinsteinii]